jgi:hypothetical protein
METAEIKKTAQTVMQGFVNEFARQCDPRTYAHGRDFYMRHVDTLADEAKNYIHGASRIAIALGASPTECRDYITQVNNIRARYLANQTELT